MSKWKRQLEEYDDLLEEITKIKKGKRELKFERTTIRASDVAKQYYCEKKVEMEYIHGEIETEVKNLGTEAHENLLEGSEEATREKLWQDIYQEKPVLAQEILLLAKYKDIILSGKPDSVLFYNGYPLVVFEYKFSKSRKDYLTYHVQARTYGILLRNMGFDTSKLLYAVVVADRRSKGDTKLTERVIESVSENEFKEAVIPIENAVIYLRKFNSEEAELSLDWAIEFWKDQREATQTMNPNKCRTCEYREECRLLIFE